MDNIYGQVEAEGQPEQKQEGAPFQPCPDVGLPPATFFHEGEEVSSFAFSYPSLYGRTISPDESECRALWDLLFRLVKFGSFCSVLRPTQKGLQGRTGKSQGLFNMEAGPSRTSRL